MTSLPIASNAQRSANAANTASSFPEADVQSSGPFAALLARQIGDLDLSALDSALMATRIDAQATTEKPEILPVDIRDQSAVAAGIPADPSGAMAVLLSQLPQASRPLPTREAPGQATSPRPASTEVPLTANTATTLPEAQTNTVTGTQLHAIENASGENLTNIAKGLVSNGQIPAAGSEAESEAPGISGQQPPAPFAPAPLTLATIIGNAPAKLPGSGLDSAMKKLAAKGSGDSLPPAVTTTGNAGKANAQQFQIAELQLNPPGLLPPDTATKISGSQADSLPPPSIATARDTMENALPTLRGAELAVSQPLPSSTGIAQTFSSHAMGAALTGAANHQTGISPQSIATPLGNSGWAEDFSQTISWMSTQQGQTAELHLNPPDLGPLDVQLKIADNQATVQFSSPHSSVREAVESALPRLREILADSGIMLGNATVSDQSPKDRNAGGSMNQGSGSSAQRELFNETAPAGLPQAVPQQESVRRHNGMVDTFA